MLSFRNCQMWCAVYDAMLLLVREGLPPSSQMSQYVLLIANTSRPPPVMIGLEAACQSLYN